MAAAFAIAVSCNKAEGNLPAAGDETTGPVEVLTVSIGDVPSADTKSTVHSYTGKMGWSEGDRVAVWYDGGSFAEADISANSRISVSGNGNRAKFAVFPASAKNAFNLVTDETGGLPYYKITYPAEFDITGKPADFVQPPMVAVNDPARQGLRFFHVGGVVRFKLYAIPVGTKYIKVTSTSGKPISGDFPIYFSDNVFTGVESPAAIAVNRRIFAGDAETAGLYTSKYQTNLESAAALSVRVQIHATGVTSETDGVVINLPVPIGTYDTFTLDAVNASGATLATDEYQVITQSLNWDCDRTKGLNLGQAYAFKPNHPMTLDTYVPGKFTVSKGKQVWFASGNLVVTVNNGDVNDLTWAFEDEQYNYSYGSGGLTTVTGNPYIVSGQSRRISHFGWATAGNGGYDDGQQNTEPYSIEYLNPYYETGGLYNAYGYGPSVTTSTPYTWGPSIEYSDTDATQANTWHETAAATNCEWGIHFDDAGVGSDSETNGSWYTLSGYEWTYLLNKRPNAVILVGKGMIHVESTGKYVNGLFILPDNWELPSSCRFRPGSTADFSANIYTTGDSDKFDGSWAAMEAAGAVFLPTSGYRFYRNGNSTFASEGYVGYYWSSSASSNGADGNYASELAFCTWFDSNGVDIEGTESRSHGISVRLVHK